MSKIKVFWEKYYWIIMVVLGALQVWMIAGMNIYQLGDLIQDNVLMVNYAESLGKGEWRGAYNNNTLLKRLSYPFFLVVCNKLNIPYMLGLGVLWTSSVVVLIIALKKVVRSRFGQIVLFAFVLFNPVMYNSTYAQMIYRNAIVPAGVVLSIATLIGLYTRRNEKKSVILLWSAASGIAFAFFWNIREDSVWLLPFYVAALVITAITMLIDQKKKREALKRILLLLISVVCVAGINCGIKYKNYRAYGVYTDSELFETNATELKNLLTELEEEDEKGDQGIIVSKDTVEKLYEISPAFATLEPYMNTYMYGSFWQLVGDNIDDGEVYSGYFFWGLRDVVQAAGYYESGKTANDFYGEVCDDIQKAIDEGMLKLKETGFRFMGLDIFGEESALMLEAAIDNVDLMLDYEKLFYGLIQSTGSETNLRRTEVYTGNTIIYGNKNEYNIEGWIVPLNENDEISLKLVNDSDNVVSTLALSGSDDVYAYFESQGESNEKAKFARFQYESQYSETLYLEIFVNGESRDKILIDNILNQHTVTDEYNMFIGQGTKTIKTDSAVEMNQGKNERYNRVIRLYRNTGNVMAIVAVIGIVILLIDGIIHVIKKEKHNLDMVLILVGVAASYAILIYGVSANYYAAADSEKMWGYLAGTCPLQGIFIGSAIVLAVEAVITRIYKLVKR